MRLDRRIRLRLVLCAAAALLIIGPLAVAACGQGNSGVIDARRLGIDLPAGSLIASQGEHVTTEDEAAQPAVGRIHVRVGEGALVLLPDGQLVARVAGKFALTDRPFNPLTKEQVTPLLAAEFPKFKTKSTNHYVYAYDTSEEFILGTSRILETMLPGVKGYAELNKLTVHSPEFPLVVVMFRTERDFQRYRKMPEGVVAYYDPLSNRVVLYEQSRLAEVRPDLAVQQAISTIAHEGVHQILNNIGVQQRLSTWPMWLSEGLAEYFAPTSMGSRLHWKGAGQVNDLRMFELEQYLQSNAAKDPDGALVEHTVLARQLTSTGYASAWALTHYLAKNRRSEFNDLLKSVSQIPPLADTVDLVGANAVRSNREEFARHFGDDFKELERRLVLFLKKQPYTDPFLNAPHFVATLILGSSKRAERSASTFHSLPLAQKWLRETLTKASAKDREASQRAIRAFTNRPQAEAYAKQWLSAK